MQKIYFIQMAGNGWNLYRTAGITTHFSSLRAAKMLMDDTNAKLIVLDRKGNRLN
ncbi:MAG: hypothetical protein V4671_30340 [Armatimonadota bacterium]